MQLVSDYQVPRLPDGQTGICRHVLRPPSQQPCTSRQDAHVCQLCSSTPTFRRCMLPACRAEEGPCQAPARQRDARGHRTRQCIFRAGGPGSTGASASAKRTCRSSGPEGRGKCGGPQGEPLKLLGHCIAACNRVRQCPESNSKQNENKCPDWLLHWCDAQVPACCLLREEQERAVRPGRAGLACDTERWHSHSSQARIVLATACLEVVATRQKFQGRASLLHVQQCSSHPCRQLKVYHYSIEASHCTACPLCVHHQGQQLWNVQHNAQSACTAPGTRPGCPLAGHRSWPQHCPACIQHTAVQPCAGNTQSCSPAPAGSRLITLPSLPAACSSSLVTGSRWAHPRAPPFPCLPAACSHPGARVKLLHAL